METQKALKKSKIYSEVLYCNVNATKFTFSSNNLNLLTSLWRNSGSLFFTTLLQFIDVCDHWFMHSSLRSHHNSSVRLRSEH